ncbi:MAG: MerR family transcriptional regulator [Chloroflexi bacterium]|nr:MerR family transcriptional regulator [Chloroflexota bacterium]
MMETLSIGAVAGQVDLPASTLRYYESIGLLPPPQRVSGQRRYLPQIVARLEMIKVARGLGFTLDDIKILIDGLEDEQPPSERWRHLAESKLPEVVQRLEQVRRLKQVLLAGLTCDCVQVEDCFDALGG